jgi:two-component system, chemotaxis family, response regulator Rcp1
MIVPKYMESCVEVLLIDDNPGDTELTAQLLKRGSQFIKVHSVVDGAEAMAFLRCEGKYLAVLRPHLIVLDLKMPRKDGWAVLADVKSDCSLKKIPLVIFSTSESQTDIARCYDMGANSYVAKPLNLEGYTSTVIGIGDYWFGFASLVRQEGQ